MSIPPKPIRTPNEVIMEFHRVTGLGVSISKLILNEASPLLYARFIEAIANQKKEVPDGTSMMLNDPIEEKEGFKEAFLLAEQAALLELSKIRKSDLEMSYDRQKFKIIRRILKDDFEIDWFSKYEMNPIHFRHELRKANS